MKKLVKNLCKFRSDKEAEVYVGSAFCKHCRYFNGIINNKTISCLTPKY